MPHMIIDYSGNLDDAVDMTAFCQHMRTAMAALDVFPMPGVRVRAVRADHWAIADGDPGHGYIDISVRLRAGRPQDVREAATRTLFDAAQAFLAPVLATRSLALSFEMRDIDPALSPKTGTIRDHLEARP